MKTDTIRTCLQQNLERARVRRHTARGYADGLCTALIIVIGTPKDAEIRQLYTEALRDADAAAEASRTAEEALVHFNHYGVLPEQLTAMGVNS